MGLGDARTYNNAINIDKYAIYINRYISVPYWYEAGPFFPIILHWLLSIFGMNSYWILPIAIDPKASASTKVCEPQGRP